MLIDTSDKFWTLSFRCLTVELNENRFKITCLEQEELHAIDMLLSAPTRIQPRVLSDRWQV